MNGMKIGCLSVVMYEPIDHIKVKDGFIFVVVDEIPYKLDKNELKQVIDEIDRSQVLKLAGLTNLEKLKDVYERLN